MKEKDYIIKDSIGVDAADVLNLRTEEEMVNNTAVHAKWEYGVIVEEIEIRNETYQFKTPGYFCSCCKGDALENGDKQMLTKYCPHCGAKMENGEDYK